MKKVALAATIVAVAFAAQGSGQASVHRTLRVDRPEKGVAARVTHVRLIKGIVRHRTIAIVLTDTRCNPDQRGVSHCLNVMRLANEKMVIAVHDHRMMDMPCLSPGERVILTPQ